MSEVHMGVLLGVVAFLALVEPSAQLELFTGHPPEPPPRRGPLCPPCHCEGDVLDCTGLDLVAPTNLSQHGKMILVLDGLNTTGFGKVIFDGNSDTHALMDLFDISPTPFTLSVLPDLPGVRSLSLKYRGIASISSGAFVGLRDLSALDLSHNQLTADAVRADVLRGAWNADSYEPFPLRTLDLSHNALHTLLRRALEHLDRLETLLLNHNPLRVLDKDTEIALASATKLQVLGLSGCGLAALPDDLSSVLPRGLRTLDLSQNFLTTVPGGLPSSLNRLVLDYNPIRTLPATDSLVPPFARLDQLQELSLSHMPLLEAIKAGAFLGMPRLRTLTCSHNSVLRHIDPAAFSHLGPSRTLTEVSFRNNSLQWLHPRLLGWSGLSFLDVAANPWHCSCNFTRWAAATLRTVNLNSRDEFRCSSPAELSGLPVLNASSTACSSTLLEPESTAVPSLFTNALLLLLVAVVITTVVMLVHRLLTPGQPGRLMGKAGRFPRRMDSMKTPLYVVAPTEEESPEPHQDAAAAATAFQAGPTVVSAVFSPMWRASGDL